MLTLIVGLLLFFGPHSVSIIAPEWRNRVALVVGGLAWAGLYSVLSIVGFVLIVRGYGLARQSPLVLYTPPLWLRYIAFALMLPVFPLGIAAYLPGRIKTVTKHPLLAATKLWASAHLLSVGTLAGVLLFGSFLAWAAIDRISFKGRKQRPLKSLPSTRYNDAVAIIGGVTLYVVFVLWLHLRLIGVQPTV